MFSALNLSRSDCVLDYVSPGFYSDEKEKKKKKEKALSFPIRKLHRRRGELRRVDVRQRKDESKLQEAMWRNFLKK